MAPPTTLSSGATLYREERENLRNGIFDILKEDKIPENCEICDFWKCNSCDLDKPDQEHCYVRECNELYVDCLIMGDDTKCTNIGQFIKILLEMV